MQKNLVCIITSPKPALTKGNCGDNRWIPAVSVQSWKTCWKMPKSRKAHEIKNKLWYKPWTYRMYSSSGFLKCMRAHLHCTGAGIHSPGKEGKEGWTQSLIFKVKQNPEQVNHSFLILNFISVPWTAHNALSLPWIPCNACWPFIGR